MTLSGLRNRIDRVLRRLTLTPAPPAGGEAEDLSIVGLRDTMEAGWFDPYGNELFHGFPIDADDVVLDVGCGDGGNLNYCARRGAALILVDVDPDALAAAVERLAGAPARTITPVVSDANPLPIADGTATRIISTEVIEHVDDPAQFLRELARVGQPGALYLLTVPHPVSEHLQERLAAPSYFEKPNHVRIIEQDAFVRMVEDAGLVVESRAHDGFYRAMWLNLFWAANVDFTTPHHPLLDNWARTWGALLETEGGLEVKRVLDDVMPRSQLIIARKPNPSATEP